MNFRLSSILLVSFLCLTLTSCIEELNLEDLEQVSRGTLEEYIESHDVSDYTVTESGLYYKVSSLGIEDSVLNDSDVIQYRFALYAMNDELIFDGFEADALYTTSLGVDAVAIQGVIEACELSNIKDSLSLLVPYELAYGEFGTSNGLVHASEDLRVEVQPVSRIQRVIEYVEDNGVTDYQSTSSGLFYTFENEGEGDLPTAGQIVEVHYTGYLFDGTKFDSSVDRDQTFSFTLGAGEVISGWDEGIALFKKGQIGTLYMPYNLGYGIDGAGTDIMPYDHLVFEIEVIDIQ